MVRRRSCWLVLGSEAAMLSAQTHNFRQANRHTPVDFRHVRNFFAQTETMLHDAMLPEIHNGFICRLHCFKALLFLIMRSSSDL